VFRRVEGAPRRHVVHPRARPGPSAETRARAVEVARRREAGETLQAIADDLGLSTSYTHTLAVLAGRRESDGPDALLEG
jgi:hypothetical protein